MQKTKPPTLRGALRQAREALAPRSEEAGLEAEVLLKELLGIDRVQLYLWLEKELYSEEEERFWNLIRRRSAGEPLAYIVGHKEFFGLDFILTPQVFIPRPETELVVEKALELAENFPPNFSLADVGTGCGAIAISLALNFPQAQIYAIDISIPALEVARKNCCRFGLESRVRLLQGNLLEPLPQPVHLILANLPYVPERELPRLAEEIQNFEPTYALDGGPEGLSFIKELLAGAKTKLLPGGAIILEIASSQTPKVNQLVEENFPQAELEVAKDLSGLERAVIIQKNT